MSDRPDDQTRPQTIPVVEEELRVGTREVETGRVRVRTVTREHEQAIDQALTSVDVDVERVAIDREIHETPEVYDDGETLVIPVVEERLVVEKRLFLREEIHIRRRRTESRHQENITLRSQDVIVERETADGDPAGSSTAEGNAKQ